MDPEFGANDYKPSPEAQRAQLIWDMIVRGKSENIRIALERNMFNPNTPITSVGAVSEDNIELVIVLLQSKKVDPNFRDFLGRTALHYAASNGSLKMVKLLLQVGVDPNCKNHALETPLMKACQFIELETVDMLLMIPSVDVNAKDKVTSISNQDGKSALDTLRILSSIVDIKGPKKDKLEHTFKAFEARGAKGSAHIDVRAVQQVRDQSNVQDLNSSGQMLEESNS